MTSLSFFALHCKWILYYGYCSSLLYYLVQTIRVCFPLFFANGVVYLSELKSEVSISCQQDRISNKYVNNASPSDTVLGVALT